MRQNGKQYHRPRGRNCDYCLSRSIAFIGFCSDVDCWHYEYECMKCGRIMRDESAVDPKEFEVKP